MSGCVSALTKRHGMRDHVREGNALEISALGY